MRMIEIDPAYVFSYINRADMKYSQLNDFAAALPDYDKAISIEPDNTTAYMRRGLAKRAFKDFKGTMEDFSKAIELEPKNFWAYAERAETKRFA